jgi:hypothetical protein
MVNLETRIGLEERRQDLEEFQLMDLLCRQGLDVIAEAFGYLLFAELHLVDLAR